MTLSRPTAAALRLLLVSDGRGDAARLERLVRDAVAGGLRAVQLREPDLSARQLAALCDRLRPLLETVHGVLLVNDRVDVAAAGHAHGVQVGHRSLAPAGARSVLRPGQLLGFSAHDDHELELAAAAGCDFALLAPVLPTNSKPGAPALGFQRAAALTRAARLPVLWLGGFDETAIGGLRQVPAESQPLGIVVRSSLCDAPSPSARAAALLAVWELATRSP